MSDEALDYVDVGLLDHVQRYRRWVIEGDDGRRLTRHQQQRNPLPEELMSALAPYIGDGLGKVTVGAELAHSKDYGCKAQAFVSISVTCNNTLEDATAVHDILHQNVRALVNEDLVAMIQDRDEY